MITHGKFLSTYDLIDLKWIRHCKYPADILSFFKTTAADNTKYYCVVLINGELFTNVDTYTEPTIYSN